MKDLDEGSACSLPACWQTHSFTGTRADFFGILKYTEDHIRHPALGTEELLDSWTCGLAQLLDACQDIAIVGITACKAPLINLIFIIIDSFYQFCFFREP